jgi:hypothetical protein
MSREREHVPDWEHLLFAALLLAFIVWYLWTAAAASLTFSNLILIAPVGAVAAGLLLYIASVEIFGRMPATSASAVQTDSTASTPHGRFRSGSLATIAALMGLFGAFVMVGKSENLVRVRNCEAALMQGIERVPRPFMNETAVDVEQGFVFLLHDDVTVPDFVEQRLHSAFPILFASGRGELHCASGPILTFASQFGTPSCEC